MLIQIAIGTTNGVKVKGSLSLRFTFSRNFLGGATHDPCDDIYCGSKPFSEVETTQVSQFLKAHPEIIHYINFHSYSQLWMSPWGKYSV